MQLSGKGVRRTLKLGGNQQRNLSYAGVPAVRAFIAAPLIGTIMFLVATVFVVGMVNTESQEVNRATVDAYHNKLVSMLELYRLDLYSLFVDGLRQNVEDFLAGIPWINLNSVSENSAQARYANCFEMKKAIRSQIISSGTSIGGSCSDTLGPVAEPDRYCNNYNCPSAERKECCCSGGQSFLNGLSDLLEKLRNKDRPPSYELVFEGVVFKPVKFDNWAFTCSSGSVAGSPTGRQLCEKLVPRAMFDCQNFAYNPGAPYRCCEKENGVNQCAAVVPEGKGCDSGDFLLSVNLADPVVYKYMPRIDATDGAGNQIRSGALGENPLELRVRYPIFKYRHLSFGFFSRLQLKNPDLADEPSNREKMTPEKFAGQITKACNYLKAFSQRQTDDPQYARLTARIWFSLSTVYVECDPDPPSNYQPKCYKKKTSGDGFEPVGTCPTNLDEFIADYWTGSVISTRTPQVDFIDNDERFRVNPGSPNKYSWDAVLCFPTATSQCS